MSAGFRSVWSRLVARVVSITLYDGRIQHQEDRQLGFKRQR